MALHRYALSSLIDGLDSDLLIGFHFHPTHADGIRIVNIKNGGGQHLICKEDDDLFRRPPEQLEECYCFTNLKLLGENKVERRLWDRFGRYWKNIDQKEKVVVNNSVIGFVTKLVLHLDKKTPTEWHIVEYRDTERPVDGRYVLCHVYKLEKKKDSGRGDENQAQRSNTQPDWVSIGATNPQDASVCHSQQFPSCPNPMDDGEMNQFQHYEMGQGSYTQPATYQYLTGEHVNQDQIHGADQSSYTPPDDIDMADWINEYLNSDQS